MKIDITKKHLYFTVTFLVLLGGIFVIGYGGNNPTIFGHSYGELDLRNSIQSSDIVNDSVMSKHIRDRSLSADDIVIEPASTRLALNVLQAQDADNAGKLNNKLEHQLNVATAQNADAAKCEFLIYQCNGQNTGRTCRQGFSEVKGSFTFRGTAIDFAYNPSCQGSDCPGVCVDTTSNSWLTLCCKNA